MKTIIVPTDFSRAARNAALYAAEIAKFTGSKLILFHATVTPNTATELPYPYQEIEEERSEKEKGIRKLEKELEKELPGKVETYIAEAFSTAHKQIADAARLKNADLIIMAQTGENDVAEKLLGSTPSALIRHIHIPVIIVPANYHFKPIQEIAIACDTTDTFTPPVLNLLKQLTGFFKAHTVVVKILGLMQFFMYSDVPDRKDIDKKLKEIPHTYDFEVSENISQAINEVANEAKAEMIVVMPKRHSTLGRFFHNSATKHLAFDSKKPLLVLPPDMENKEGIFEAMHHDGEVAQL